MFAAPLIVGAHVSMTANLTLTAMFTVASILRGYFVRRHYNRKQGRRQLVAFFLKHFPNLGPPGDSGARRRQLRFFP